MRFSGELFSPTRSRRISGAASDLGAVRALATGGSVESRDLPACHGDDQMKRIFFAVVISVFAAALSLHYKGDFRCPTIS
jgi:hypothetical protein